MVEAVHCLLSRCSNPTDYTFLCALKPEMREAWAKQMRQLLAPGGELLTLIFPLKSFHPDPTAGPPYLMSVDLVKGLLEPLGFISTELKPVPEDMSHSGRGGLEWIGR